MTNTLRTTLNCTVHTPTMQYKIDTTLLQIADVMRALWSELKISTSVAGALGSSARIELTSELTTRAHA